MPSVRAFGRPTGGAHGRTNPFLLGHFVHIRSAYGVNMSVVEIGERTHVCTCVRKRVCFVCAREHFDDDAARCSCAETCVVRMFFRFEGWKA